MELAAGETREGSLVTVYVAEEFTDLNTRLQEVVDGNLASMSAFPDVIDPAAARRLTSRITAMIAELLKKND